jgi:hypothetical protein
VQVNDCCMCRIVGAYGNRPGEVHAGYAHIMGLASVGVSCRSLCSLAFVARSAITKSKRILFVSLIIAHCDKFYDRILVWR